MRLSSVAAIFIHVAFNVMRAAAGNVNVTCKSARVTSFANKLSTSWVISQHPGVTRASQCAVLCQGDSRCVSFVYSGISKDCRLYAVVKTSSDMATNASGYYYYNTCRAPGYYGSACTTTTQCLLTKTRCFLSACRCEPGYSFDAYKRACVTSLSCAKYSTEFESIPNYFINANNEEALLGVDTAGCLDRCLKATNYTCRSLDVRLSPDPACSTASVTKLTALASDWLMGSSVGWNCVHYQRHCSL